MTQSDRETTRAEVRRFIIESYLFGQDDGTLGDGDSLLEKGVIDSTGILELVAFLEKRFAIKVLDEEMVPANLDSLDSIVRYLGAKR